MSNDKWLIHFVLVAFWYLLLLLTFADNFILANFYVFIDIFW